jgi:hypothetical protein
MQWPMPGEHAAPVEEEPLDDGADKLLHELVLLVSAFGGGDELVGIGALAGFDGLHFVGDEVKGLARAGSAVRHGSAQSCSP